MKLTPGPGSLIYVIDKNISALALFLLIFRFIMHFRNLCTGFFIVRLLEYCYSKLSVIAPK